MFLFLSDSASVSDRRDLDELCNNALSLPGTIAHFAAGEVDAQVLLADIFSLISAVRLAEARHSIAPENATILVREYELLAEKLAASVHLSPFASADDFTVPHFEPHDTQGSLLPHRGGFPPTMSDRIIEDNNKGHTRLVSKGQQERSSKIFDFILANKRVSIKDITVVIRNCSEKTIQRELAGLVREGRIKKVGERRWSFYLPA